jgi:hypothetical protein
MRIDAAATQSVFSRLCHQLIGIAGRVRKPPYFGTLVSIRLQRCIPVLRAMPRANPTDPANPLISGATGSMSERTFRHLERFSGLNLHGSVAANAAAVLDGPYATRGPSGRITGLAR